MRRRDRELLRAVVELLPAWIALPLGIASHVVPTSIEQLHAGVPA
ncbi:hypothetical protein [Paenibacillus lautus]|nr:hypothetical protein [Paenibacillus lautus]